MSMVIAGGFFCTRAQVAPMHGEPQTLVDRAGLRLARNPLQRALYLVLGTLSLGLATLGLFIRGFLPTTPFLLLAAYCYGRSSERMYRWIYGHRVFGPILNDWEQHRSLSHRTKRVGIASVWVGILVSMSVLHFTVPAAREVYLQAMLLVIATSVTVFLATRPTSLDTTSGMSQIPRRGLTVRTKAFAVSVLWLGLLAAAMVLQVQAADPPAPYHWIFVAAMGLLLTAPILTQYTAPS